APAHSVADVVERDACAGGDAELVDGPREGHRCDLEVVARLTKEDGLVDGDAEAAPRPDSRSLAGHQALVADVQQHAHRLDAPPPKRERSGEEAVVLREAGGALPRALCLAGGLALTLGRGDDLGGRHLLLDVAVGSAKPEPVRDLE